MSTFLPAVPHFPNLPSYSQQDFLRMFDRLLPSYYLEPLKSPGPGYEYLQAVAKIMERTSQSVAHMGDANFIGTATGGARATATVELYRDNSFFGAVTLLPGTLVGTTDGYLYQTVTTVEFAASQVGAEQVQVEAIAKGYDWNKPGPVTAANGEVLAGSINRLVSAVVPEGGSFDPTLKVRQINGDATGGVSAALDGIGNDRGIFRQTTNALVQFKLTDSSPTQVTLLPGTRVATADGYLYQTTEPLNIPANTSGVESRRTAQAIPVVLPDAYAAHGPITQFNLPRWGSPSIDLGTLEVTQLQPYARESDEAYRARIALLPLVVTPNNIEKLINQVIGSTVAAEGKTYSWREMWDIRFQTAYSQTSWPSTEPDDFPINTTFDQAELNVAVPEYDSDIFVYDYEPEDPLSNRYLGQKGMIVFALPQIAGQELPYAGLAELLDGATAAGIPLGYILTT